MIFKKAILLIHGFAGGTYDLEYLAHRLEVNRQFDVYTFTLAGHDGLFKDNMKEKDWIKSAQNMIEFLIANGYKKIYIVGHSMGGVITTILATKYKEIKKIVLLSASFRYLVFENDNFNLIKSIVKTKDLVKEYGKEEVINRLLKMPPSVLKEFQNIVKNNQDKLNEIQIPSLIIQGNKDNLVPLETAEYIYNKIPTKEKEIIIYDGVTHDIFKSKNKQEIVENILHFLKK